MIALLGVVAASAIGAPARYLVDRSVARRTGSTFPWGTLVINVTGSFVLGLVVGLGLHHGLSKTAVSILGGGLCGAYTTFSTFSVESIRLVEEGALMEAVLNIAGSIAVGLLAAAAGLGLAVLL